MLAGQCAVIGDRSSYCAGHCVEQTLRAVIFSGKEYGDFGFDTYRHEHSEPPPTYVREQAKTGRNEPCPCGSGRKYKKCCMPARH